MGIRVLAAFSPSRGMVKSQGHNDKGLICKNQKLQCNTQMEVGKKNHLHLISGMILNRNQSLLMRRTMYLFYTFTGIDKCTH